MILQPPNFHKKTGNDINVSSVKDVAEWLPVSPSWIYKHYQLLGGVKVGGSVLLPSKEKIYERLFQSEKEF